MTQGNRVPVTLLVNGCEHRVELEREELVLTGTKKGCDRGECGACTVHMEGRRINACLALAVMYDGREITTIEASGPWSPD